MAEDKVITLGSNELPNLVSSYRLDDRNYLQWAQYIRTTLKGRKKLSYIEGNNPPRDDPKFKAWDDENSLIMTWLWNSMTPEISQKLYVLFLRTKLQHKICNGDKKRCHKMINLQKEKPFTKSSHGEYCTYCQRSRHTKDTCYKRYGKEKDLERMGGNKCSTQMWVNQTISNMENGVAHPSTSQLDQDIQAFSKEEMDRFRALLNSTSKPLGSCGLTMNGKSSFNISSSVPQSIWILHSEELTTARTIRVAKEQGGLYYLQHTKIDNGVVHELTCVNTLQQNGVAKRKNHHHLEVARALLFQMSIPNDVQVQVQEVTPTQDVQVQEVTKPTLVLKQVQMSELDVSIPDNSIEEQVQLFEPKVSIPDTSIEDVTDDMPIALRKGKRSYLKYPISQFMRTDHLFVQHQSFIAALVAIKTPTSVQEALKDENWVQAMKEEMEALEKNSTWEIVDRPKDKRAIGCRWIYTVKCKSDGTLERYKARLVAKGYTQTYRIDYEGTFSPVAKMNTVRVIISLAAQFSWNLQQFDVKNAFLHGDLEEVYMEIPLGFYSHNVKNKVCRLKKALYGLKQSPRAWFGRFAQVMISLGYRQSQGDHTLFIKHSPNGKLTLLLVCVDDMIVTSDDEIEKLNLKEKLATQVEMKELGKLKYFLGIEVAYSKQ
ncbi:hypothetical protein CR513_15813, partial [Mucuna pruriens]